jgi:hypothetical protein
MQTKKPYPRLNALGLVAHEKPIPHVKWKALERALGSEKNNKAFGDQFGCQPASIHGPYPWDVEAVLTKVTITLKLK